MTQDAATHGPKPELMWLPLAHCHVDNRYQRTLDSERSQALVARLMAAWRWASCGALLSVADGKDRYLLLDGQHRAEAARRIGITELPALVVAGLSLKDQAAAFVGANLDRVAVNGFALHHARLVAGDERAGLVDRICRAADVSIPKYPIPADNLKPGQTLALASIAQLAHRLGEGGASAILTALAEAYRDQAGCLRASLMRAVGNVYEGISTPREREQSLPRITDWLKRQKPTDLVLRTGDRRVQRLATAERLSQAAPPIASVSATRRYPVVYADPPWKHTTWSEAGKEKSQENHYPTLSQDQLKALPISALAAPSAALFLWSTGPQLAAAIALIEAWGFTYKSHVVWRKTNEDGTPHRGTGYWFISVHELLLVGTRGDIPAPLMGTQELSEISAPVGRHSEKPARFHELIERYFPDVGRIELFARARREGWDAWGNEVGKAG